MSNGVISFAGIGSRSTPPHATKQIIAISSLLAKRNWVLRSGGADGADLAFEIAYDQFGGNKEIYLPSRGFNNSTSSLYNLTDEAFDLAEKYHPTWKILPPFARKLMARNGYQVLGPNLNDPVKLVVCWTQDGVEQGSQTTVGTGGTGQAIRIADDYKIPVFNLQKENRFQQLLSYISSEMWSIIDC